jgi:hypothetical protein
MSAPEDGEINTETRRVRSGQGLINKGWIKSVVKKFVNISNSTQEIQDTVPTSQ